VKAEIEADKHPVAHMPSLATLHLPYLSYGGSLWLGTKPAGPRSEEIVPCLNCHRCNQ
jgi:hypothetical protein